MSESQRAVLANSSENGLRPRNSLPVILLAMMIVAGSLQNVMITLLPSAGWATNVDDLLLVVALVCSIGRWGRLRATPFMLIATYVLLMLIAAVRSTTDTSVTIELVRSMVVPAMLILMGMTLLRHEFSRLALVWLVMSSLNSFYMILEMFGLRLVSPQKYLQAVESGTHLYDAYQGLPGSYIYWHADGSVMIRAGGFLMNPPVAGTMVAIGAVLAFHLVKRRSLKLTLLIIHLIALYASQGRGGAVIVAVGIVLPWVVRRTGLVVGLGVLLPLGLLGYQWAASAGDSVSHVEGFTHGLSVAFTSPMGDGFGTAGNAVKLALRTEESSESLVGIALVAGGFLVLLLLIFLAIALIRRMRRNSYEWVQYLGLGAIVSALLSESSGALAGAAFMWLALGVAISLDANSKAAHDSAELTRSGADFG